MGIEPNKEGNHLFDLVKNLAGISQDDFLETYTQPCLLQIPVEGTFPDLEAQSKGRATRSLPGAASTMHISLKDLEGLKRSKKVDEALVHFLPDQATIVMGRAEECDLVLNATGVSRKHAELRKSLGNWMLVDLGSHNGTFINGNKLEAETPTPVQDKQNLWFGSYRALFLFPEQIYNLAAKLRKKSTG